MKVKCDWSIDKATFLSEMLNQMDQNQNPYFDDLSILIMGVV